MLLDLYIQGFDLQHQLEQTPSQLSFMISYSLNCFSICTIFHFSTIVGKPKVSQKSIKKGLCTTANYGKWAKPFLLCNYYGQPNVSLSCRNFLISSIWDGFQAKFSQEHIPLFKMPIRVLSYQMTINLLLCINICK